MPNETVKNKVHIIPAAADGPLGYDNCGELPTVKASDSQKIRGYVDHYAFVICAAQMILDKRYGKGQTKAFLARNTNELLADGRVALDIVHDVNIRGAFTGNAQHTTVPIETVERLVERLENGDFPDNLPANLPLELNHASAMQPVLAITGGDTDNFKWTPYFKAPFQFVGFGDIVFDADNNPVLEVMDFDDALSIDYGPVLSGLVGMLNGTDYSLACHFTASHSGTDVDSVITLYPRHAGMAPEPFDRIHGLIRIDIRGWGHLTGSSHGLAPNTAAAIQDSFGKHIVSLFQRKEDK